MPGNHDRLLLVSGPGLRGPAAIVLRHGRPGPATPAGRSWSMRRRRPSRRCRAGSAPCTSPNSGSVGPATRRGARPDPPWGRRGRAEASSPGTGTGVLRRRDLLALNRRVQRQPGHLQHVEPAGGRPRPCPFHQLRALTVAVAPQAVGDRTAGRRLRSTAPSSGTRAASPRSGPAVSCPTGARSAFARHGCADRTASSAATAPWSSRARRSARSAKPLVLRHRRARPRDEPADVGEQGPSLPGAAARPGLTPRSPDASPCRST